jgi:hypothetical protein
MKPGPAWLAATFLLLAPPAPAQTPSQWHALRNFIGAYPPALLKTNLLRRELAEILNPEQTQLLKTYTISPPITEIAKDLIAQFCQPHNCASASAFMVIDSATIPPSVLTAMSKVHSPF